MDKENLPNIGLLVQEKIKVELLNNFPDEIIGDLIRREFEKFFANTKTSWGQHDSPFAKMVQQEIDRYLRTMIREKIERDLTPVGDQWSMQYGDNQLEDLVQKVTPYFLQSFCTNMITEMLSQVKFNLPSIIKSQDSHY